MKTFVPTKEGVEKSWYVIDADGMVLGRLAARVASMLRGKHKPTFTTYTDVGDFIVVVNAEKVKLTGNKLLQKTYERHTGYPGGLKVLTAKALLEKKPEELVIQAVRGMLPKNSLGRQTLTKLKVYKGPQHPHSAQKPQELK